MNCPHHHRIIAPIHLLALLTVVVLAMASHPGTGTPASHLSIDSRSASTERVQHDHDARKSGVQLSPTFSSTMSDPSSCIGDISGPNNEPDGMVDVFDLLRVISDWGTCGDPARCPADLTGPNDEPDGTVDVFDLLKVISNWGPCPEGACCLMNGECEQRTAIDCKNENGAFHGEHISCEQVECEQPIVCPGEAIDEGEPCGEMTNDGCNVDPPVFGPQLTCDDMVCGTIWAERGTRDRDWFPISIDEPREITWSVEAAFPAQIFIVNDKCDDDIHVFASASGESEMSVSACLPPGDYRLMVTVDETEGFPCGTANEYVASVSCESCIPDGQSCEQPLSLFVDGGPVVTSTAGRDVAELPDCIGSGDGHPISPSVWFEVTGTGNELIARTCGSDLATSISVLCASCDDPTCVAGSADFAQDCPDILATDVTFCSEPGETYYIVVWSIGIETEGPVTLEVATVGGSCESDVQCFESGLCEGFCGTQSPEGCWCDDFVCGQVAPELCCPGVCIDCPALDHCDVSGSCAGVPCGEQSPDGCWCDEDCGGFDDCCDDVCDECPDLLQCIGCGEVNCVDNVGEPCGDNINDGCNSSPPQLSPISCGDTKCGNLWATDGSRDVDWFEFTINEPRVVTWSVEAESEVNAFITNGVCGPDEEIIVLDSGCSPSVNACLAPGTYFVVVGPTDFEGSPCPGFTYEATLTCEQDPTCSEASCAGLCGSGWPPGCTELTCECWCDDVCADFLDCCDDVCDHCPELGLHICD